MFLDITKKILFIPDIEGRIDPLKKVFEKFPDYYKICLGDIQDRGMESKEVLDFIMNRDDTSAIYGNHEFLFQLFMENDFCEDWVLFLTKGGLETVSSYIKNKGDKNKFIQNIDKYRFLLNLYYDTDEYNYHDMDFEYDDFFESNQYLNNKYDFDKMILEIQTIKLQIPKKYLNYIKSLPRFIETKDFIATHAPLNHFPLDNDIIQKHTFLFNRQKYPFIEKSNIHGHNGYKSLKMLNNQYSVCVDDSLNKNFNVFIWETKKFETFPIKLSI